MQNSEETSIPDAGKHERAVDAPPLAGGILTVVLISLWPLVHFANQNREQLDVDGFAIVGLTFLATSLTAVVTLCVVDSLTHGRRRIGATAGVAASIFLFYNYHVVYDSIVAAFTSLGIGRGENHFYLILVLAVSLAAFHYLRSRFAFTALLLFSAIVNVYPVLGLTWFMVAGMGDAPPDEPNVTEIPFVDRPNVFHIITDGYARHDSLSQTLGYDNSEFLDALEARGFYVARSSYANYPTTFLSIASTVGMDYPATELTAPFVDRRRFYDAIRGQNRAVNILRNNGYRFAYLGSAWWDGSKCTSGVDICLSTSRAVMQTVISLTPLRRFFGTGRSLVSDIESRLDDVLQSQPVYLFAHTLAPHPPRTFTSSCTEARAMGSSTDGLAGLTFWGDKEGYIQDLECTNRQIVALVDAIVERSPAAVILVHGDHGTAFDVDWTLPIGAWPERQIEERFAILMAVRLPDACDSLLYNSLSPVNLYRVVFACLAKVDPELASDVLYVSPHEAHPDYGKAYPYRHTTESSRDQKNESAVPTPRSDVP